MEGIYLQISLIAIGVLMAVLPILASVGIKFLKTKVDNKYVKEVLDLLEVALRKRMESTGDSIVKGLKEKSADGKLTVDEAKEVKNKVVQEAKDDVKKMVVDKLKAVETLVDNLDEKLEKRLEEMLAERAEKKEAK